MSRNMIEIENVSKRYRLGKMGTGTLSHDLNNWWMRKCRANGSIINPASESPDEFWSLRNIEFSVKTGEVCGIVGRNGAGKSTLLKILSKITKPTTGKVRLGGRIASLLEVGTGFHPELTGRENVFLNGAILGMTRTEIKSRFDEIIDFSGVHKFLDTPVKRYSSGMYVRLAFAVSAHLEPEILIVDEVLSVGDLEFQQKCMGKMKEVSSSQGRTVLFVSHNNLAIKQLCDTAVLLDNGIQKAYGPVDAVLKMYHERPKDALEGRRALLPTHLPGYFTSWKVGHSLSENYTLITGEQCVLSFDFIAIESLHQCEVRLIVKQEDETLVMHQSSLANKSATFFLPEGSCRFDFAFAFPVRPGKYKIEVVLASMNRIIDLWISGTLLTVLDNFEAPVNGAILHPAIAFSMEHSGVQHSRA